MLNRIEQNMKLSIDEVAKLLNLPISTIQRWIRQGKIPAQKSSEGWIFQKQVLEKWAAANNLSFSPPREEIRKQDVFESENLLIPMKRGGIIYGVKGDEVEAVLKYAVDSIPDSLINSKKDLYEKLLEREQLSSTGIGKGVAIPHPRTPLSGLIDNSVIITCFLENPIHFNAVDRKPVFVMFMLLSTSIKAHLHLLSKLSFCVRDDFFVEFLRTVPASDAFFSQISDCENRLKLKDNI
ncbi:MAG: excisionase [Deltaproteobacteria bacterium]|nr:MAG: excisionase [Deltaproteobacteria bacterium]